MGNQVSPLNRLQIICLNLFVVICCHPALPRPFFFHTVIILLAILITKTAGVSQNACCCKGFYATCKPLVSSDTSFDRLFVEKWHFVWSCASARHPSVFLLKTEGRRPGAGPLFPPFSFSQKPENPLKIRGFLQGFPHTKSPGYRVCSTGPLTCYVLFCFLLFFLVQTLNESVIFRINEVVT